MYLKTLVYKMEKFYNDSKLQYCAKVSFITIIKYKVTSLYWQLDQPLRTRQTLGFNV